MSGKSSTSLPFRNFFINSYIIPGFLFLLSLLISCFTFRDQLRDWTVFKSDMFEAFLKNDSYSNYINSDIAISIELLFIAIILFISLIMGNAISVIGGFLFDKLWMEKSIGWPYERILSFFPKRYSRRAFHILIFTTINISTVLFIFNKLSGTQLSYIVYTILFFYFILRELWIKKIIYKVYGTDKNFKTFLIKDKNRSRTQMYEETFVFLKVLFKNSEFELSQKIWINVLFKSIIYVISLGFFLDLSIFPAIVLGKFFGLTKPIDVQKRKLFKNKFKKIYKTNKLKNNTEIYWNSYIYLSNKNFENIRIANSHLKRSILLRNLAATGVIMLFLLLKLKPEVETLDFDRWQYWCMVWYISTYLLFIGYNHIFYKYYTKFLIRCFILEEENNFDVEVSSY